MDRDATTWTRQAVSHAVGATSPSFGEKPSAATRIARFSLLEAIGQGGMGRVYAAYDPQLDRRVALKVLLEPDADDGQSRLVREAHALARLAHPNVVAVHEVGVEGDQCFVAMEFVEGLTLRQWLAQNPVERRDVKQALRLLSQAGRGLAAAHTAGIVHRDFKPGNVLIGDDGRVRVADFGLARVAAAGTVGEADAPVSPLNASVMSSSPLTATGSLAGTPGYMAPEQWYGHALDHRTDQFAFCCVAWEVAFGVRPFDADTPSKRLERIANGTPTRGHGPTPFAELEGILLRGMRAEPEKRHRSLEELLDRLAPHIEDQSRRRTAAVMIAAASAIAVASLGLWVVRSSQATEQICSGAASYMQGVWDDARRRSVRDAMLGTNLAYAQGVWERTKSALDFYAAQWVEMHTNTCEATAVRREQSEQVLDLRMACLQRASAGLGAAVSVLAGADSGVVGNAHKVVADLTPLATCADVDALLSGVLPPSEADAAVVDEVGRLVLDSRAQHEAGRYQVAADLQQRARGRLEGVEHPPTVLDLQLATAATADALGEYDKAKNELLGGLDIATNASDHDAMQRIATELVYLLSVRKQEIDEAQRYGELALRLSEPGSRGRAAAHAAAGSALYTDGKNAQAVVEFEQAIQIGTQLRPPPSVELAEWRQRQAGVLRALSRLSAAEQEYRAAIEIMERELGADHPEIAEPVGNLGLLLGQRGRLDEAETALRRALSTKEAALGENHPGVAKWASNLGNVLRKLGRFREAEEALRHALSIHEATVGPRDRLVAFTCISLGYLLLFDERYVEAVPYFERARGILVDKFGADYPYLGNVWNGLARTYLALSEHELAGAAATRALAVLESNDMRRDNIAEARFALAQALSAQPAQRRRAITVAREALAEFASVAEEGVVKELAEVRAWLAAHDPDFVDKSPAG